MFHAIAVRSIHTGSIPSAVVCWVDVVFAKLAVAVTAICPGGPPSASQSKTVHGSMQKQLDCHLLRAATQLPSAPIAWKLRLQLLTLECTRHMGRSADRPVCRPCVACCLSPRPASTLRDVCATVSAAEERVPGNYQVSLLRIQATSWDSCVARNSADRDRLFSALRSHLGRALTPQTAPASVDYADLISTQERIACAMFLSLFAVRCISDLASACPTILTHHDFEDSGRAGYRRRAATLSPKHRSCSTPLHYGSTMSDDGTCVG